VTDLERVRLARLAPIVAVQDLNSIARMRSPVPLGLSLEREKAAGLLKTDSGHYRAGSDCVLRAC
jgi:hypothetical protein